METYWLILLISYCLFAWGMGLIVACGSVDELAKDMKPTPYPGLVLGISLTIAVLVAPIKLPGTTFKWLRDHINNRIIKWKLRRLIKRIRGNLKDYPEALEAINKLSDMIEETY